MESWNEKEKNESKLDEGKGGSFLERQKDNSKEEQ